MPHRFEQPQSRPSDAFTLIELLIVVSLITLLIAMLLPSLRHAMVSARKAYCLSNQRQILSSVFAYAHEYDRRLPFSTRDWPHAGTLDFFDVQLAAVGFEHELARCPAEEFEEAGAISHWWNAWWFGRTVNASDRLVVPDGVEPEPHYSYYWYYKMYHDVDRNAERVLGGSANRKAWHLTTPEHPDSLIALACWGHDGAGPGDWATPNAVHHPHGGYYSGFLDGHARFAAWEDLRPANWSHIYNLDWTRDGIFGQDVDP